MDPRTIGWLLGVIITLVALAQVPPIGVALYRGEDWFAFACTCSGGMLLGGLILTLLHRTEKALNHRSAFLAVTLAWMTACVAGAAPFYLHPSLKLSMVNAFFESASGFTTTGATVLSGLDQLPHSVLLWRSLTQWLGGMGMVLLGVAVLPLLGVGGMSLYRAETPGLSKDKMTPRIGETAKLLWVLYLGVTVVLGGMYFLGGMTSFDAVCHAMTTISTGGMSTHDAGFNHWDSGYINTVATLFMLIGGTSFAILHRVLTQGITWAEQPELRAYLGIFLVMTLLIAFNLRSTAPEIYPTAAKVLEHASFQVASILTSTGFATQDFTTWSPVSQMLIFSLFFVGGMAGSTGGGVKVIRVLMMMRFAVAQFFRLVHPHGFSSVKLGNRVLEDAMLQGVAGFIGLWIMLLLVGAVLITATGVDPFTSLNAAAVSLGNIGPGLGGVGPTHTWFDFAPLAKLVTITLMILGRLEIYTVLVILTPGFWRR